MAIAWALVDVVIGLFTVRAIDDTEAVIAVSLFAIATYTAFGFMKALLCGVISYPLYRWWCQRQRGQRMDGKFAIIVTPEQ